MDNYTGSSDEIQKAWKLLQEQSVIDKQKRDQIINNLNRQQRNSIISINSLDQTMNRVDQSINASKKSVNDLQNCKEDLQNAMKLMVLKIEDQFTSIYKLPPSGNYTGIRAKNTSVEESAKLIIRANHLLIITGAGISASCGIPVLRGEGQFWMDKLAADNLTMKKLKTDKKEFWKWISRFQSCVTNSKPNHGHIKLYQMYTKLQESQRNVTYITQNVDGLHSNIIKHSNLGIHKGVIEIHGNINYMRCMQNCSDQARQQIMPSLLEQNIPTCKLCEGEVRPDILLLDETYEDQFYINEVLTVSRTADTILVIGTKLDNALFHLIIQQALETKRPKIIIEINPKPIIEVGDTYSLPFRAEDVLSKLCDQVLYLMS